MTFYIFSMSHNIYVSNFYFTVDKETKSFGFPKMNLDVPQPHICSLKTTEYEGLPLISFKGVAACAKLLFRQSSGTISISFVLKRKELRT